MTMAGRARVAAAMGLRKRGGLTRDEYLWSKVQKTATCWIWIGHINRAGYGALNYSAGQRRSTTYLAHRLIYEALRGPVPEGLALDHLCKNKLCVNPDHLQPVTHAINSRRGRHCRTCTCTPEEIDAGQGYARTYRKRRA